MVAATARWLQVCAHCFTNDKELHVWRLNTNVPAFKQNPIPDSATRSRAHALRKDKR